LENFGKKKDANGVERRTDGTDKPVKIILAFNKLPPRSNSLSLSRYKATCHVKSSNVASCPLIINVGSLKADVLPHAKSNNKIPPD
jgi:hypothetical protein